MKTQVVLKMNISPKVPCDILEKLIAGAVGNFLNSIGLGEVTSATALRLTELPPRDLEPTADPLCASLRRAAPEIPDTFICTITTRHEPGGWRAGYAPNGLSFVSPLDSFSAVNGLVEKMSRHYKTTRVEFTWLTGNVARVRFERNPEL